MHTILFAVIKKQEVRGEGADAKAKRALTIQEFYKQLQMLRAVGVEKDDYNFSIKYPAMANGTVAVPPDCTNRRRRSFWDGKPNGPPLFRFCN